MLGSMAIHSKIAQAEDGLIRTIHGVQAVILMTGGRHLARWDEL